MEGVGGSSWGFEVAEALLPFLNQQSMGHSFRKQWDPQKLSLLNLGANALVFPESRTSMSTELGESLSF